LRDLYSGERYIGYPVFAPDGRTLAAGVPGDKRVRLWDTGSWQERPALELLGTSYLAFTPDGRTLLGVGGAEPYATSAWMIDTATGKVKADFPTGREDHTYCLAFSADGKFLVTGGELGPPDGGVPAFGDRGVIRLYDVAAGKELRQFTGIPRSVSRLAFSPDGKLLASGGWSEPTVSVWDVATGKRLRQFAGHRGRILALAFSPDGRRLVSGGDDTTALVWDVSDLHPAAP
jgi:WD40 repeat protein